MHVLRADVDGVRTVSISRTADLTIMPNISPQKPGVHQPHVGAGVQYRGHTISGRRLPPWLGVVALSGAGGGDHELQLSRRGDKLAVAKEDA